MGMLYLNCDGICLSIKGIGHNAVSNIHILETRFSGDNLVGSKCANPGPPSDLDGCPNGIGVEGNVSNVYIEHNAFAYNWNKPIFIYAYARDAVAGQVLPEPTNITISYNHIRNSYFGMLAGVSADVSSTQLPTIYTQVSHITLYGNWFDQILRRSARAASYTEIDEFNNLISNYGGATACTSDSYGFGPSADGSGQVLLTNNVYEAWTGTQSCKEVLEFADKDMSSDGVLRGLGLGTDTGSLLLNGATATVTAGEVLNQPPYTRPLLPASAVEANVRTNAGPQ
jgi:pectate lyase